jgi:hypothetical protein
MQIIFDENVVQELKKRYVVLELDTIMQPSLEKPKVLYAIIENLDLNSISKLGDIIAQHASMVEQYKNNLWDIAAFNANALKGSWHGELDEFYDLVISTSNEMLKNNSMWDGIRHTTPKEE